MSIPIQSRRQTLTPELARLNREIEQYARGLATKLERNAEVRSTTDLAAALHQFVVGLQADEKPSDIRQWRGLVRSTVLLISISHSRCCRNARVSVQAITLRVFLWRKRGTQ